MVDVRPMPVMPVMPVMSVMLVRRSAVLSVLWKNRTIEKRDLPSSQWRVIAGVFSFNLDTGLPFGLAWRLWVTTKIGLLPGPAISHMPNSVQEPRRPC